MNRDGFVHDQIVKSITFGSFVSDELFQDIIKTSGRMIESVSDDGGKQYIRALYGHTGHILEAMNWGKFVPYTGRYDIFCLTHFVRNGLGAVNFNRRVNVLNVPERCENKGVKAFISIKKATEKGLSFWSQVGDRYGNKVFCFDVNLSEHFDRFEYVADYTSEEHIKKFQTPFMELIMSVRRIDEKTAIKHIQKLMYTEDDDDDDDETLDLDISTLRL